MKKGPINTIIANSVPVSIRARAFSISILVIHMLGDAISPLIIGVVSDSTGSLKAAVLMIPVAIGIACVIWICGWRLLPEPYKDMGQEDTQILVQGNKH